MRKKSKLEYCTASVQDAIHKSLHVDQIEFCTNLEEDGLTPKIEDVLLLKNSIEIPIKVMIRQRGGDFIYTSTELDEMIDEAQIFIKHGFDRLVFGASKIDRRLDIEQITIFCNAVSPAKVCIHKAIDLSPSILEDLILLLPIKNIVEVLTSGGAGTAMEGKDVINQMVALCDDKINIIAAGSIRYYNLDEHQDAINALIFHGKKIV